MKRTRMMSALLLVLAFMGILALTACSPSLGNESIAFLRAGQLWTIDPGGTNAFAAVAQDTAVIGYGLSPDHHLLVFRTLDGDFAKTEAAKHLVSDPITGLVGDVPGTLSTIGLDGGSPIPIILSNPALAHSDAWWSPDSNRLLYREGAGPTLVSPELVSWWISQNDQPAGIARKALPPTLSIPSINASSSLSIGNTNEGIFTTTLAGTNPVLVQRGTQAGHPLVASLERLLWQPGQQNPALLYAVALPAPKGGQGQIALTLRSTNGQTRTLANCICRQFAWSPNGQGVLYSTNQGYTLLNVQTNTSFSFDTEHGAIPYWSPDSNALLLDGLHTLTLLQVATQRTQILLSDGNSPVMTDGPLPGSTAFLQPVANSLWNSDGQRFVVETRGRTLWQGKTLHSGNGLYVVTLNGQDIPQKTPALVDNNPYDTQPGWSYVDPNTSFLI